MLQYLQSALANATDRCDPGIRYGTLVYVHGIPVVDPIGPLLVRCHSAGRYASSPVVFATGSTSVVTTHSGLALDSAKIGGTSHYLRPQVKRQESSVMAYTMEAIKGSKQISGDSSVRHSEIISRREDDSFHFTWAILVYRGADSKGCSHQLPTLH